MNMHWKLALASIGLLTLVGAADAVTTLPTTNYAGDQDGSSRYFGLLGLYGIAGDSQVDALNHNLLVAPQAVPSGGATHVHYYSAASTNSTNVKNAGGTLYSLVVQNSTSTAMELKLYNTSSAPTCSSGTGVVGNYLIPANTTSPGFVAPLPVGATLGTGISFCLVAFGNPAGDTDSGNAVTGAVVNLTYN